MKILALLFVLFPTGAFAQVACFSYAGGVLSCDGPSGNTTITPLGNNSGVITQHGQGHNSLEPYTIITPTPSRPSQESDYSLTPLPLLPSLRSEPSMPGLPGLPGLELPGLELP